MRYIVLPVLGILLIFVPMLVSADVIVYNEDFGDRSVYPDGNSAIHEGDITNQQPYYYDTYACPPKGKVFYEIWDATQGKGEVVNIGGRRGHVLRVWHTGRRGEWGKSVHNTFMKTFRPAYDLPLVVEFKFRPARYNPKPTAAGPYAGAAGDPAFDYKEIACKWRFYADDPEGRGAGYRMKYSLYYDGTLWQAFRGQGFPDGSNPGSAVDIGGKDAGPEDVWNAGTGKWLEYRLFHDTTGQEIRVYLTNEDHPLHHPFVDENGVDLDRDKIIGEFTVGPGKNGMKPDEKVGYVRFRQFGELQGGADQTASYLGEYYLGDENQDGSPAEFDDIYVYYMGEPASTRMIRGEFTIEYPYWCYFKFEDLEYQIRSAAGSVPREPIMAGMDDFHLWSASKAVKKHEDYPEGEEPNIPIIREYAVGPVPPGTYDLVFKHANHLAAVVSGVTVTSAADATGIDFTLFAGDASGDFINFMESGVPVMGPDNDCDSWDLATVKFEMGGCPLGLSAPTYRGRSGDFDGDGYVTDFDLAAVDLKSGHYPPDPEPGNWYVRKTIPDEAVRKLLAEKEKRIDVFRSIETAKAPVIDGNLDDACWQKSEEIRDFLGRPRGAGKDVSVEYLGTSVRILHDKDNLYVGFDCPEPLMDKISAELLPKDAAGVAIGDRVGVVIDYSHSHSDLHLFMVNAAGGKYDAYREIGEKFRAEWNADWRSAAQQRENGWSVEFSIPFAELPGKRNPVMGINFIRFRKPGIAEKSATSMSWGSIYVPPYWADMYFEDAPVYLLKAELDGDNPGVLDLLVGRRDGFEGKSILKVDAGTDEKRFPAQKIPIDFKEIKTSQISVDGDFLGPASYIPDVVFIDFFDSEKGRNTFTASYPLRANEEVSALIRDVDEAGARLKELKNSVSIDSEVLASCNYLIGRIDQLRPDSGFSFFLKRKLQVAMWRAQEDLKELNTTLDLIEQGKDPFTGERGSFVRTYFSKVDRTRQPYRLFVPKNYGEKKDVKHPLCLFLHGWFGTYRSYPITANI